MNRQQVIDPRDPGTSRPADFVRLNLIGESAVFRATLALIERVSRFDVTVLIHGESGTGKELAARAIHYLGPRQAFPFVPVNCGAIPDNLIENEFFGHVKGAFTDAKEGSGGLIAYAEGGTLFLDEIECLSRKGQVVLLRFLQDQVYRPVGGRQLLQGNVRIIAASNRDLVQMVKTEEFRQDLFYRLAIVSVTMPPLRQRGADTIVLANYFIPRLANQYGLSRCELDDDSLASLMSYDWPGNVRELENLIHREFLLSEGRNIRIRCPRTASSCSASGDAETSSPSQIPFHLGFSGAKAVVLAEFERTFVTYALVETRGNISLAARKVGKERRAFGKLLKKHGIDRLQFQHHG